MQSENLLYLIALPLLDGVGLTKSRLLISYVGLESLEKIFLYKEREFSRIPDIGSNTAKQIISSRELALDRAQKELNFIRKKNLIATSFLDEDYPFLLKECDDAPLVLYSEGNIDYNRSKMVSIVGTRNITEYGKAQTIRLVEEIAERHPDACIVSGMAYGVDITAHRTAVKCGLSTIGVLAHGLDMLYPLVHRSTAVEMFTKGGLVTEFLSKTNPDRQNFVRRNRIVAGISCATIVIESGSRGGSLITAELASSYNREVFAVPGRLNDKFSEGCNKLIRINKASMIASVDDLDYILGWNVETKKAKNEQPTIMFPMTAEEEDLYSYFKDNKTMNINQLSIITQKSVSQLSSMLINMEFNGYIKCLPGNMYQRL